MKEEKLTYCRICEPMCGLRVEVEDGRVQRIRGDRDHPLSRGWICRRGVAFADVHNDPDRLRKPMRRGPEGMKEIGWDRALEEVAGKLSQIRKSHGPDSIGVYMGNPMAFCTYGALGVPAFVKALGTSQFFTSGSQDCNNKFAASQRVFGSPVTQPIPDLDHVHYLLILGANPVISGMSFIQVPRPVETLNKIRKRGGDVVVVDPRRSETARLASEHLTIQPDTDCFFLLSLLCVLMERERFDPWCAGEDPQGFSALREVARHWPPERTEPITGIPADKVEEIALRLTGSKPAACYGSVGINLGRSSTLTYWLILVLNLLSGHFDRKGGSILCRGMLDVNRLYNLSGVGKSTRRSRTGDFLPIMGTYPASLMAREILNERRPGIRALVVVAGNPLLSVPNEMHLKSAFEKLELMVCLDIYQNETGAFADYLLPTTDFLEREDFNLSHAGLQLRRFGAFTPSVVEPDGQQRSEWNILEDLSERMGDALLGKGARFVSRILQGIRKRPLLPGRRATDGRPALPRLLLRVLLRIFGEVDLPTLEKAARGILLGPHEYERFRTKTKIRLPGKPGKISLAPDDLLREAWKLEGFPALREKEGGDFLLVGKRERFTHNTWMHNLESLRKEETTNYLYMHPEDAKQKGIEEGETIRVLGLEEDRVEIPCRLSTEWKRGVVALPHGWGHRYPSGWRKARTRPGVNVNRLASDSVWKLEPISGNAWMNGLPVNIERMDTEKGSTKRQQEE